MVTTAFILLVLFKTLLCPLFRIQASVFNVKANARTGQVASLGRYGGASSNVSVVGPPVLAASGLYHGHHTSVSPSTDTIPVSVHHRHHIIVTLRASLRTPHHEHASPRTPDHGRSTEDTTSVSLLELEGHHLHIRWVFPVILIWAE